MNLNSLSPAVHWSLIVANVSLFIFLIICSINEAANIDMLAKIISAMAPILVGIFSVGIIFWQVHKQNLNLLKQQESKIKDELKLTIYLEVEKILQIAVSSLGHAVREVDNISAALSDYLFKKNELGLSPEPIKERTDANLKGHYQAALDLTNITSAIERYEIALPKIETLGLAFFEKQSECSDKFHKFFVEAVAFIPFDVPENHQSNSAGKTLVRASVTSADIERLKILAQAYADCAMDLQGYIYDFRIILQNSLLGHIFDRQLSGRKKANSNLIILKTDDSEDMKKLKNDLLRTGKWGDALSKTWNGVNRE